MKIHIEGGSKVGRYVQCTCGQMALGGEAERRGGTWVCGKCGGEPIPEQITYHTTRIVGPLVVFADGRFKSTLHKPDFGPNNHGQTISRTAAMAFGISRTCP